MKFLILFILCLKFCKIVDALRDDFSEAECGITEEIPGEARTRVPWVSAIFVRYNELSSYKYLIQGVLISPTVVVSIFGGAYGSLPRGTKGKYKIFHPKYLLVAVGLRSSNISEADKHTQFRRVTYINPYRGHSHANQDYHIFILHLDTPIILTPFANTICISPLFLVALSPWEKEVQIGGYAFPKVNGSYELQSEKNDIFITGSHEECQKVNKFYYRSNYDSNICGRIRYHSHEAKKFCYLHGSSVYFSIGAGIVQNFIGGLISMIPRRQRGAVCDENLLYMTADLLKETNWLYDNLDCSPNGFNCGEPDNGTCISIDKICNFIPDCKNEDDEDDIFCDASNYCKGPDTIACSIFSDHCIRKTQICDGVIDCPSGNDESPEICKKKILQVDGQKLYKNVSLSKIEMTPEEKFCPQLPNSEGIIMKCRKDGQQIDCNKATINSEVLLHCAPFYISKFRTNSVQMKCDGNYLWKPFRAFGCKPDCGIIDTKINPLISRGTLANLKTFFPWFGALFLRDKNGEMNFICGASLIERTVLITAAHCMINSQGIENQPKDIIIVLAPLSTNFEVNFRPEFKDITQIFTAQWIKIPKTFSQYNLNSDIALIGLNDTVNFSQYVRPVCYLLPKSYASPAPGTFGKVAGLGFGENNTLANSLKYIDIPVVSMSECKKHIDVVNPSKSFCAGFMNETGLCIGDSGGGFVVLDPLRSPVKRYILKGIVSQGGREVVGDKICKPATYTIFTHVDSFVDWTLDTLESLEIIY